MFTGVIPVPYQIGGKLWRESSSSISKALMMKGQFMELKKNISLLLIISQW
jgi:hypothetical protein